MNYSRRVFSGAVVLLAAACGESTPTAVSTITSRTAASHTLTTAPTGMLVDQSFTGTFDTDLGINATGGVAQGFIPTQSSVSAVDLFLTGSGTNPPLTLTVNLRSGALDGPIIGTTTIDVPANISGTPASPTEMTGIFAAPIAVTPGNTYYIQIDGDGGFLGVAASNANGYPNGQGTQGGSGGADLDFGFRTYYPNPNPPPQGPTTMDQCKKGGWAQFTVPRAFKNQGDCVSFVVNGK